MIIKIELTPTENLNYTNLCNRLDYDCDATINKALGHFLETKSTERDNSSTIEILVSEMLTLDCINFADQMLIYFKNVITSSLDMVKSVYGKMFEKYIDTSITVDDVVYPSEDDYYDYLKSLGFIAKLIDVENEKNYMLIKSVSELEILKGKYKEIIWL